MPSPLPCPSGENSPVSPLRVRRSWARLRAVCHSSTSSCVAPNANPLKRGIRRDASCRLPLSELLGVPGSHRLFWSSGLPRQRHAADPWSRHGQGQWVHSVSPERAPPRLSLAPANPQRRIILGVGGPLRCASSCPNLTGSGTLLTPGCCRGKILKLVVQAGCVLLAPPTPPPPGLAEGVAGPIWR